MSENKSHDDAAKSASASNLSVEKSTQLASEKPEDIRQWLSNLSADDLAVAFGFVDGPMMSVFSQMASLSGPSTATVDPIFSGGQGTPDRPLSEDIIDWEGKASLKEVEKTLEQVMGVQQVNSQSNEVPSDDSPLSNQEAADSSINIPTDSMDADNIVSNDVDEQSAGTKEEPEAEEVESDAFRIREDMEESSGEAKSVVNSDQTVLENDQTVVEEGTENAPAEEEENSSECIVLPQTETTVSPLTRKIRDLMAKVCVVFPSAFTLATANDTGVPLHPFITLHSSYLRTVNSKDLLSTLDEITRHGAPEAASFFIHPFSSSSSWLDLLREVCKAQSPETASLPLYMLLLLRFQIAVFDAFEAHLAGAPDEGLRTEDDTHKNSLSSEDDPEISKTVASEPVLSSEPSAVKTDDASAGELSPEKLLDDSSKAENQTGESERCSAEPSNVSKNNGSAHFSSLLAQLTSFASVDAAEAKETIEPFADSFPELVETYQTYENVFLIPLVSIARRIKASDDDFDKTMRSIDDAVLETVRRIEKAHPSATTSAEPLDSAETEPALEKVESLQNEGMDFESKDTTAESVAPEPVTEPSVSPQVPASKKGNKKKKKKKKRKGSTGGQTAQSKDSNVHNDGSHLENAGRTEESRIIAEDDIKQEEAPANTSPKVPGPRAVAPTGSFDTDNSLCVFEDAGGNTETASMQVGGEEEQAGNDSAVGHQGGLEVPVIDGVGATCEVAAHPDEVESEVQTNKEEKKGDVAETDDVSKDDNNTWETVEVRSRGNRKKSSDRNYQGRFSSQQGYGATGASSGGQHGNGSKKSKAPRTNASRKRTATRKMVREMLSSVLDAVDEEVRKRRPSWREGSRLPSNKWAAGMAKNRAGAFVGRVTGTSDVQKSNTQKKEATMRDVLVGRQGNNAGKGPPVNSSHSQKLFSERVRQRADVRADGKNGSSRQGGDSKKNRDTAVGTGTKMSGTPTADQNTAPTVPETLSAVSANSGFTETTPSTRNVPRQSPGIARSDSSSRDSGEALKPQRNSSQVAKENSPSPPLPTLLSPGSANSASSSVASSLDAPHAGHHGNHHSSYPANENDVGYHLLDVCGTLTRDINIFMKRRESALSVRRHERRQVLVALQETLSTLWPDMCTVDMYGSCATELDLPSSDLDVVVCGLDRPVETVMDPSASLKKPNSQSQSCAQAKDKAPESGASDNTENSLETQPHLQKQRAQHQVPPHVPIMYGHMSLNAERVVRLAMELEQQPWAVHVKAIPTASVPVIKILADPARLPGAVLSENGEWRVEHPVSVQSTPVNTETSGDQPEATIASQSAMPQLHGSQSPPPWRGADVVNGLLKVDITFEGPEHGGIGSTVFSTRLVQECCNETGLPPESTPFVQVLMVLKEMLAQRRLNEPFSGGLSSYAVLLLVGSVLRERSIIRKELEKVECQRRMVAAGGGNSVIRSYPSEPASTPVVPTHATTNKEKHAPKAAGSRTKKGKAVVSQSEEKLLKTSKPGEKTNQRVDNATVVSQRQEGSRPGTAKNTESIKNSNAIDQTEKKLNKPTKPEAADSSTMRGGGGSSSWASIARNSASTSLARKASQESSQSTSSEKKTPQQNKTGGKVSSFADAVANGTPGGSNPAGSTSPAAVTATSETEKYRAKKMELKATPSDSLSEKKDVKSKQRDASDPSAAASGSDANTRAKGGPPAPQKQQNTPSSSYEPGMSGSGSLFPQGFHDVIEVLCSGETSPGKLLMHFLLFYGQHFDSQSTVIDYSGTHKRDADGNNGYSHLSPYLQRRTAGSFDPMTGMLTVDPIIVYDPLEGAETLNVARSCFAWSSIRWVFAQSYMTLSSAVEMSASHTSGQNGGNRAVPSANGPASSGTAIEYKSGGGDSWNSPFGRDESGNMIVDPSSSLLELLLSF